MTTRVTLMIPTMNRCELLCRLLSYYVKVGFDGDILIADSTDLEGFEATAERMLEFSEYLSIQHYHLPGMYALTALQTLLTEIKTPYVGLICDDDFLISKGLIRCADFLDHHDDYVAAHGLGILVASDDYSTKRITTVGYYRQPECSQSLAADRVAEHLRNYSVSLFSLQRSDIWVKALRDIPSPKQYSLCCDRAFVDELLPCTLTVAYGKVAQVDGLYLVRQTHDARFQLAMPYQWLTNEKWQPSYIWFRDRMCQVISAIDGVSEDVARQSLEQGFSGYLYRSMFSTQNEKHKFWADLSKIVKANLRVFGCHKTYHLTRYLFDSKYISLESLMKKGSVYHDDFMPVYEIVTKG